MGGGELKAGLSLGLLSACFDAYAYFGFDIYFGQQNGPPDPVILLDFYYLLKQAASSNNPSALLSPAAKQRVTLPESAKDSSSGSGDPDKDTISSAQQINCVGGLLNLPN